MRRRRQAPWVRELVREQRFSPADLIWPVFVREDDGEADVASMPGITRLRVDELLEAAAEATRLRIPALALFPVVRPNAKTEMAEEAFNPENLVCRATRALKQAQPELGLITDVALDPFTSHGQDGLMRDGRILNDETVEALARQALNQAAAGADVVAPSDMMDGRVGAIREALDGAGQTDTLVLSYAAKYASAYYGPFRDALGSASSLGKADKRSYQMDPANGDEALTEVALDLEEGADMILIKPGLPYLDVIQRVKQSFGVPTFAYQVSGEYAMLRLAGARGVLDYRACMTEAMLAFKRAGCDAVFSYAAPELAAWATELEA